MMMLISLSLPCHARQPASFRRLFSPYVVDTLVAARFQSPEVIDASADDAAPGYAAFSSYADDFLRQIAARFRHFLLDASFFLRY